MFILDTSALIAYLAGETGTDVVEEAIKTGAIISSVNLSEVAAKLFSRGAKKEELRDVLQRLTVAIITFDEEQAYCAGELLIQTQRAGLSFGDRACLALAKVKQGTALTADTAWSRVNVGVHIEFIR
jgi:PIN domain nuclease of toxin-antitoxin system